MVEQQQLFETKTVANLNPRSQAVKSLELTVVRALALIEAFDLLEKGQDWADVPGTTYRKILGERYEHGTLLSECFERWKKGTLHREVQDLAANLPPSALERKEIADGLSRISARPPGRSKGSAVRPTSRQRSR